MSTPFKCLRKLFQALQLQSEKISALKNSKPFLYTHFQLSSLQKGHQSDTGGARATLTLERLKRVHEVQVGLQRDQAWLDHVCISQMCCKNYKLEKGMIFTSNKVKGK